MSGATWQEIADDHGYKSPAGARAAAKRYAAKHELEVPKRR
jgi:hypothetical protein